MEKGNPLFVSIYRLFLILVTLCVTVASSAQHLLIVTSGEEKAVVVNARGRRPMVMKDGKATVVTPTAYGLAEGGAYLPVHVSVRDLQVRTSSIGMVDGGEINREFSMSGKLETAYNLDDVFLVISLENERGEKGLFLMEVGSLESRRPKPIAITVPMNMQNVDGHYQFYLFSAGCEVFQTLMPFGLMEAALTTMVQGKIKDVENAPAKPFVGPAPEYPGTLYKQGVEGRAVLSFSIDAYGSIMDPQVVEASRPEFGAAVMAVIREWRFLPKVKNGLPQSSKAQMPFVFNLPKKR